MATVYATAHKGYLISKMLSGEYTVSKDGYHICYAQDVNDAKRKIEALA